MFLDQFHNGRSRQSYALNIEGAHSENTLRAVMSFSEFLKAQKCPQRGVHQLGWIASNIEASKLNWEKQLG